LTDIDYDNSKSQQKLTVKIHLRQSNYCCIIRIYERAYDHTRDDMVTPYYRNAKTKHACR